MLKANNTTGWIFYTSHQTAGSFSARASCLRMYLLLFCFVLLALECVNYMCCLFLLICVSFAEFYLGVLDNFGAILENLLHIWKSATWTALGSVRLDMKWITDFTMNIKTTTKPILTD